MASSTCVKCGQHSFQIHSVTPTGSRFKFNFVQCSSCGAPAGVLDFHNTGEQIITLTGLVADLTKKVDAIAANLSQVKNALDRR